MTKINVQAVDPDTSITPALDPFDLASLRLRDPRRSGAFPCVGVMTDAPAITRPHSRLDLAKEGDAILKRARCDAMTGAKKDPQYRRNKRTESKRLARRWREKLKKLETLGPASPARSITPDEGERKIIEP